MIYWGGIYHLGEHMKYKFSKYNTYYLDQKGMYLYNYVNGINSLSLIQNPKKINEIIALRDSKCKFSLDNNLFENALRRLADFGIIIPADEDEKVNLHALYMNNALKNTLSLTVMPTEKCNFRCKYCYENYQNDKMSKQVQLNLLKYIQKHIKEYTALHIGWFGGEPLLAYDTILELSSKIKQICANAGRMYTASITTNGYLLTPERISRLLDSNVFFYQITLDGLENRHNFQRPLINGGETYDVIINNLMQIKQIKFNNHIIPNIMIRMNFLDNMKEDIDEIIEFYGKNFTDSSIFNFIFREVGDYGGEKVKEIKGNLIHDDLLCNLYSHIYNSEYNFNISNQIRMLGPGNMMCYAAKKNSYVIGSDGSVYKCTVDFNNSKIGKLGSNGDLDIDKYRDKQWYTSCLEGVQSSKCEDCVYVPSCLSASCPRRWLMASRICKSYSSDQIYWIFKCYEKNHSINIIN